MSARRIALVPGVLALLPTYAGIEDPVAELRSAAQQAVRWLVEGAADTPVSVAASNPGASRVADHLVGEAGARVRRLDLGGEAPDGGPSLIIGNGSASRTEKAPGHLHPAAADFDDRLDACLRAPDPDAIAALDRKLADEVWADVEALVAVAESLRGARLIGIDYAEEPFGVCYRVVRWESTGD